jgi:hypothetical protein
MALHDGMRRGSCCLLGWYSSWDWFHVLSTLVWTSTRFRWGSDVKIDKSVHSGEVALTRRAPRRPSHHHWHHAHTYSWFIHGYLNLLATTLVVPVVVIRFIHMWQLVTPNNCPFILGVHAVRTCSYWILVQRVPFRLLVTNCTYCFWILLFRLPIVRIHVWQ